VDRWHDLLVSFFLCSRVLAAGPNDSLASQRFKVHDSQLNIKLRSYYDGP
jgi:hypothetical protein